ncbi:MAG TPA: NADH-quinone oxidoreductase subunit A [Pirellulales bacterium]|nr:NADH-quinone oxidoreductase subunit A [Pirellulales bacterium]
MSPTLIVGYLALFVGVGTVFLFVNLLVGKFLRPKSPNAEKLAVYECGEPTIGSSFVQFDLRFYVVALLFIIFDVEVAFFFPWATVYGKATHLMDPNLEKVEAVELTVPAVAIYRELGVPKPTLDGVGKTNGEIEQSARNLALASVLDIGVFFGVLMVGFAYVWRRGDLDWVRAVGQQRAGRREPAEPGAIAPREPALVG